MSSASPMLYGEHNFARIDSAKDGSQVVVYRTIYDATGQEALACLAKVGTVCSTLWSVYDSERDANMAFDNPPQELIEAAVSFAAMGDVQCSLWGPN